MWKEFCQQVPELESLSHQVVLVAVNCLQGFTMTEDDGMVLVFRLTLAQDDAPRRFKVDWQLHPAGHSSHWSPQSISHTFHALIQVLSMAGIWQHAGGMDENTAMRPQP
jgi:hypothetical protein